MAVEVYENLYRLFDLHPVGCPYSPELIEIFKILFSEDEARVALGLIYRPLPVQEIATRAGVDPQEAKQRLESLADKGMIFAREKDGEWGYALFNFRMIFQNPFRKGIRDETINKLAPLWKKHFSAVRPSFQWPTSIYRVIPVQEEIELCPEILPHEKVYEMIDRADLVGITRCACRELEQKCDAPREACMIFDEACTFLVERGFARYITKDEMKQMVRDFDKAGLVCQVNNTQDRLSFLCNCCPCCCGYFRSVKNFEYLRAMVRSAFFPVWDIEKCTGCGQCAEERCPMEAIEMVDERPFLKIERCIGCGLCVTGCPSDAGRLKRVAEAPETPPNYQEMGKRFLQARGKLEDFLEFMKPMAKPSLGK